MRFADRQVVFDSLVFYDIADSLGVDGELDRIEEGLGSGADVEPESAFGEFDGDGFDRFDENSERTY